MATVLPCSSGNASDSGTEKPWTSWPCLSAGRVDGRNIHRRKRELRSAGKDTAEPRIRPTLQKDASLSRAFGAISTSPWGHLVRTEGVSPTTATALLLGGNCHQCRRAAFSGRSLSLHRGEAAGGLGAPKEVPSSGGGGCGWRWSAITPGNVLPGQTHSAVFPPTHLVTTCGRRDRTV